MLEQLKGFGLVYLATPYTKYPYGMKAAFEDACYLVGKLAERGLTNVYSPIGYGHSIAEHSSLDPCDLSFWLPFNAALMTKSDALLVAKLPGWEVSTGVLHEIEEFKKAGKPVFYLDPNNTELITAH